MPWVYCNGLVIAFNCLIELIKCCKRDTPIGIGLSISFINSDCVVITLYRIG